MSVIALTYMVAAMEKKLRELMGDEEYRKFAAKVAKGAFEAEWQRVLLRQIFAP